MTFSSYQMERLMARLRRTRGAPGGTPPQAPYGDEVVLRGVPHPAPPEAAAPPDSVPADPALVADRTALAPPVAHELERRAGSFMTPRLEPFPPRGPIPKLPKKPAPQRPRRMLADGD
jgi:hypothetical protein